MYVQGVENVYDLDYQRRRRDLRRRVQARRARILRLQFRVRRHRAAVPPFRRCREGMQRAARARSCRCRPTTSASRRATSSTCWTRAASISRDRARRLYRPRARAGQGLLRGLARGRGAADARAAARAADRGNPGAHADARRRRICAASSPRSSSAAGLAFDARRESFVTPRRLALAVAGLPRAQPDVERGAPRAARRRAGAGDRGLPQIGRPRRARRNARSATPARASSISP